MFCLWSKMPISRGRDRTPFSVFDSCDLDFSLASKWQVLKVELPVFSKFMKFKVFAFSSQWRYHNYKFKPQALHIIRIKHWKACGSGNPPSFIPALWNNSILLHKQVQHFGLECTYRIVASTNTWYYSENPLFVQRAQYIRTENPLHKQSEKAKTCH